MSCAVQGTERRQRGPRLVVQARGVPREETSPLAPDPVEETVLVWMVQECVFPRGSAGDWDRASLAAVPRAAVDTPELQPVASDFHVRIGVTCLVVPPAWGRGSVLPVCTVGRVLASCSCGWQGLQVTAEKTAPRSSSKRASGLSHGVLPHP